MTIYLLSVALGLVKDVNLVFVADKHLLRGFVRGREEG